MRHVVARPDRDEPTTVPPKIRRSKASRLLVVLSTSELGVRPDFCFDGIAARELASKGAGQTVVRVAERSSQAVGLNGSRNSSDPQV